MDRAEARGGRVSATVVAAALGVVAVFPVRGAELREETLASGGVERSYSIAVPSQLESTDEPVPLLLVLHGSGRDGASLVGPWRKLAEKEGFVVAGPDATTAEYWELGADGPDLLLDLVDHVAERWPIDRRRVYLFGHSAGASFGLKMAILESRYFAAAALHAGALGVGNQWLVERASRPIPVYLVVGTRDRFFPVETVRATRDALVEGGMPVELLELPGHTHDYYGKSGWINRRAWEFLAGHELDEDPVYEPRNFW